MTRKTEWLLCEGALYGYRTDGCLYDSRGRFHSDPPRCIKHGAPLFHRADLDGLSRGEARKQLTAFREVSR